MQMPEDVYDGVFRDLPLPRISEIDELVLGGPRSVVDADNQVRANGGGIAAGATRSPEVSLRRDESLLMSDISLQLFLNALEAQEAPPPFSAATRFSVSTEGRATEPGGRAASLPATDASNAGAPPPRPQSTIVYPRPRFGVLRPEGVNQMLAYHSVGANADLSGPPPVEPDVYYTRDGERTLLPLQFQAGSATPSTPGNAFAGMTIGEQYDPVNGENTEGLHLLADTADVN